MSKAIRWNDLHGPSGDVQYSYVTIKGKQYLVVKTSKKNVAEVPNDNEV